MEDLSQLQEQLNEGLITEKEFWSKVVELALQKWNSLPDDHLDEQPPVTELCPHCNINPALPPHTCPYKEEINGDYEICTCCDDCAQRCAYDI